MNEQVAEVLKTRTSDGGLFSLGWYLSWSLGRNMATLDGVFSAIHLRTIADIMDGKEPNDNP